MHSVGTEYKITLTCSASGVRSHGAVDKTVRDVRLFMDPIFLQKKRFLEQFDRQYNAGVPWLENIGFLKTFFFRFLGFSVQTVYETQNNDPGRTS